MWGTKRAPDTGGGGVGWGDISFVEQVVKSLRVPRPVRLGQRDKVAFGALPSHCPLPRWVSWN